MFKKQTLMLMVAFSVLLTACMTNMRGNDAALYKNSWELTYITGPRITFQGLYPNEKPMLTFDRGTMMVSGTDSCNGYKSPFTINGSAMTFGERELATLRYCGDGEAVFVNMLKDVTNYRIETDGTLTLLKANVPVMRFKKASTI